MRRRRRNTVVADCKPALLQPGATTLLSFWRQRTTVAGARDWLEDEPREVSVRCHRGRLPQLPAM